MKLYYNLEKKAFLVSRYLYCLARKKLMYILIEIVIFKKEYFRQEKKYPPTKPSESWNWDLNENK